MRRVLIDVDFQRDFVLPDGALHVPAASSVPEAIVEELDRAASEGVPILGSVDSHAWDAWEFTDNGGPFPRHCVKGTPGWLRIAPSRPPRQRFVPMLDAPSGELAVLVGEKEQGAGARILTAEHLVDEALEGVGLYFEKEVYALFTNPAAGAVVDALVRRLGGPDSVVFDVMGYCTGGYCVDAAAKGLLERGYRVRILADATAPLGGEEGADRSRADLVALGAEWLEGASA